MVNKKVLLSILTIGMLACVAGAGTWAYFSSTVENQGNTITTGTVSLTADGAAAATTPYSIGPIVPGDSVANYNAGKLINAGTVDGDLTGTITVAVSEGTTLPEGMSITAQIGTQTVNLGVGDNVVPSQKLVSGGNAPILITVNYADTGVEQTGQGVTITAGGEFVLKSNPAYTNAM